MNSLPGLRSRGGFLIEIFLRYFLHKPSPLHRFTPAERPRVSGSALVGCCWCALCGSLWGSVAAFLLWVVCLYLRTVSGLCGAFCGLCEGVPVSGCRAVWLCGSLSCPLWALILSLVLVYLWSVPGSLWGCESTRKAAHEERQNRRKKTPGAIPGLFLFIHF